MTTSYNLELTDKELTELMRLFVKLYDASRGKLAPWETSMMAKLKRLKDGQ